jgi:hypothetical protein
MRHFRVYSVKRAELAACALLAVLALDQPHAVLKHRLRVGVCVPGPLRVSGVKDLHLAVPPGLSIVKGSDGRGRQPVVVQALAARARVQVRDRALWVRWGRLHSPVAAVANVDEERAGGVARFEIRAVISLVTMYCGGGGRRCRRGK